LSWGGDQKRRSAALPLELEPALQGGMSVAAPILSTLFSRGAKKSVTFPSMVRTRLTDYADAPRCRWRTIFRSVEEGNFPIGKGGNSAVRKNRKSFQKVR